MNDTPAQHEQPNFDRVLAAHKRRARLIAQLHKQAIAAADDDLPAQQNAIEAGLTGHARWQRADGMIATAILRMIGVAIFIAALCSVLAIWP